MRKLTIGLLLTISGALTHANTDLLFVNGHILTLDDKDTVATAVAVRDTRIVAVGDDALRDQFPDAEVHDLGGRTMIPGFIDSHTHISGDPDHYIDLTQVTSIAEIQSLIRAKVAALGTGTWITGYGWSEDELSEGRKPTRQDLDAAAPENPVVLTRAGAHSAVASSLALARAGIDESTPDPDRGVIERLPDGSLNGIIRERQDLITSLVPASSEADVRPSFVRNLQALFRHGITSIVQAQDTIAHYAEWQRIYAEHLGQLPRASVQVAFEDVDTMRNFRDGLPPANEHLRLGAIKVFVDGGFTGPAAYTTKPYKNQPDYRGKLNLTESELQAVINQAHKGGWQLGIHAIGDAAIELTVGYLVEALQAQPRNNHRHYLNHFTVMPSAQTMQTMAANNIAITQQPNFTYTLEGRYAANLDGERLATNNPLRTPIDHGIHLAISSDILPIGPMTGIYAAVTRKGMSGAVYAADERLTRLEALKAYTIKGAYLTFEEAQKGTIEPGKLADLVVLSANPLEVEEAALRTLAVEATYLGGRRVF